MCANPFVYNTLKMYPSPSMSPLDGTLTSFILSNTSSPLSPSKRQNISQKNSKDIEQIATNYINTSQTKDNTTLSNCFKSLYLIPREVEQSIAIFKKHHVFIIQLLESRSLVEALLEISCLYQGLNKLIHGNSILMYNPPSTRILQGVSFSEIQHPALINLVIAFHFLVLQSSLQHISKNLKSIVSGRDNLFTPEVFQIIPTLFLESHHFTKWIKSSYVSPDNIPRYNNNSIKVIKGFIKILDTLIKVPGHDHLRTHRTCFVLKLIQHTDDSAYIESMAMSQDLLPFLEDLKSTKSKCYEPVFDILFSQQAKPSFSDITHTVERLISNLSVTDLNKLHLQIINSEGIVFTNEKLHELIRSVPLTHTVESLSFLKIIVTSIATSSIQAKRLSRSHLILLDPFTIFLKSVLEKEILHQHAFAILDQLYVIFKHFNQTKRIRNLSNLYFNVGSNIANIYSCKQALDFEFAICLKNPSSENLEFSQLKTHKLLTKINNDDHFSSLSIQYLKFIQAAKIDIDQQTAVLISKRILNNAKLVQSILNPEIFSQSFRASIAINLFDHFDRSGDCQSKTLAANAVMNHLNLNDAFLKGKVYFHYYSMNGLVDTVRSEETLINVVGDGMLSSGLHLQHLIHFDWENDMLEKGIDLCHSWLDSSKSDLTNEFSLSVLRFVLSFLNYNGLSGEVLLLVQKLRIKNHTSHIELWLIQQYCICLQKLGLYEDLSKSLSEWNLKLKADKISSLNEILSFNLAQLGCLISMKNHDLAEEKFNKTNKILKSRPEFDLNGNSKLTLLQKLQNLLLLAKFQFQTAKLNSSLQNYTASFANAKVCVKLLYSIIKSSVSKTARGLFMEIKWETTSLLFEAYKLILGITKRLGVSRDFLFYQGEFQKLNESCNIPLVNCVNYLQLTIYSMILEDKQNVSDHFEKAMNLTKHHTVQTNYTVMAFKNQLMKLPSSSLESFFKYRSLGEISVSDLKRLYCKDELFSSDCDYLSSISNADVFPMSLTPNGSRPQVLCVLLSAKRAIKDATRKLVQNTNYTYFESSIKTIPSIVKDGMTNLDLLLKEVINELIVYKDLMMSKLSELSELKSYELEGFTKAFNQCISALSSMTIFKINSALLNDLYYLQELAASIPFINERVINMKTFMSTELFPSNITHGSKNKDFAKSSLAFNDNLNIYLPENWSIVSIDLCVESGDMLFSKFVKGRTPFFMRLPLRRSRGKFGSFKDIRELYGEIIKQSNVSTKSATTSKITTKEERKSWWKLRFKLDLKMKQLLDEVEDHWICGLQSIFFDFKQDLVFDKFKFDLMKILNVFLPTRKLGEDKKFMEFDDNIISLFYSFKDYDKLRVDDLLCYVIDSLSYHGEKNEYSEIKFEQLHKSIEKLFDKYYNLRSQASKGHIVLVPSKECAFFPWESLQCMKDLSVSRMPSVTLLLDLLKERSNFTIDVSTDVYYVINPGGDLIRTQQKLGPKFLDNSRWTGLIGQKPSEEPFLSDLLKANLFVYSGHGGCDQYFRTSSLFKKCVPEGRKLPPSLLIGCSSGVLSMNGLLQPTGNVYNWLVSGCPMALVNLWDVTDKDIDQFSLSVFEKWGLFNGNRQYTISEAVNQSRASCNLPYLNGAAPVLYGLPLALQ